MGKSLLEALEKVPDIRSNHGLRHPLSAILALSVCAMAASPVVFMSSPNGLGCRTRILWGPWGSPETEPQRCPHCIRYSEAWIGKGCLRVCAGVMGRVTERLCPTSDGGCEKPGTRHPQTVGCDKGCSSNQGHRMAAHRRSQTTWTTTMIIIERPWC